MRLIIKQPVRKVFEQGKAGSLYVTLPRELGLKAGDLVLFKVENGQIVLEKIEEGTDNGGGTSRI